MENKDAIVIFSAPPLAANTAAAQALPPAPSKSTFFPFISDSNVIVSYVFLGIILSIYKYKNAYSQHVDIKAQSRVQLKLLNYELDIRLRKEVKEEKKALIKQKMGEIIYDKK